MLGQAILYSLEVSFAMAGLSFMIAFVLMYVSAYNLLLSKKA